MAIDCVIAIYRRQGAVYVNTQRMLNHRGESRLAYPVPTLTEWGIRWFCCLSGSGRCRLIVARGCMEIGPPRLPGNTPVRVLFRCFSRFRIAGWNRIFLLTPDLERRYARLFRGRIKFRVSNGT